MARKCIMILLDGAGDRSYPELDHLTPLQAAHTPALDRLARDGAGGLYHAARPGQALPSENAHFAMFGYDMAAFPGRGALEALGAGVPLDPDQVALLTHLVTVERTAEGGLTLIDGHPQASAEELRALFRAVDEFEAHGVRVRLHQSQGFRAIVTLTGPVDRFITDSDPINKGRLLSAVEPWADHAADPASITAAQALTAYLSWAHRALDGHRVNLARHNQGRPPLNGLVTQRAGRLVRARPFTELYGLRGLSLAGGLIYHGLAAYLGLGVHKVADTDRPGDDLAQRLLTAMEATADYDFIHVHTKAPDEAAHTKDPIRKKNVLEELDRGLSRVIDRLLQDPELLIVVAADHSTPSSGPLVHSGEPVPLVFHGPGVRRDRVRQYDEINAARGALGMVRGRELMYLILNQLDRAKLQGLMDTPIDQPFWPGDIKPFRLTDADQGK